MGFAASLPIWATIAVIALAAGCKGSSTDPPASTGPSASAARTDSIGQASMKSDGTIVLQLRAEGPGPVGDGLFSYPPDHAQYQEVLKHVGGLKPGETKPCPPWPENK